MPQHPSLQSPPAMQQIVLGIKVNPYPPSRGPPVGGVFLAFYMCAETSTRSAPFLFLPGLCDDFLVLQNPLLFQQS